MTDQILTLKEMAEYLKLAEKTAYRLAAESKLPGFKVGGSWRFKKEDLERWIKDNKKPQVPFKKSKVIPESGSDAAVNRKLKKDD